MAAESHKLFAQIAFNLLLILLVLVVFVSVLIEMFSPEGDLKEGLFILLVLAVLLFVGVGFLTRLIRYTRQKEDT